MRWRMSWRTAVLVSLAVIALGLGLAGFGLALVDRLGTPSREDLAAHETDAARSSIFDAARPHRRSNPHGRDRLPSLRRGRLRPSFGSAGETIGSSTLRGIVVAVDRDGALIETPDGERRRVHGTAEVRETLESRRSSGEPIVVHVAVGIDGQLTLRGLGEAVERAAPRAGFRASIVIAVGEVTVLDDEAITLATIMGNDVRVRLREPRQSEGISEGDTVIVVAERDADVLRARSVNRIGRLFDLERLRGLARGFGVATAGAWFPPV